MSYTVSLEITVPNDEDAEDKIRVAVIAVDAFVSQLKESGYGVTKTVVITTRTGGEVIKA